jgi:prepilin-type N-terminal cleavage/methylation domain-containing protein
MGLDRHEKDKMRGFTLVEILIAILILALVTSTIYAAYRGTFRLVTESEQQGDGYEAARAVMGRIQRDLGALAPYKQEFYFVSKKQDLGNDDFMTLAFSTAAHISFDEQEPSGGMAVVRYIVEEDRSPSGLPADGSGTPSYRLMRVDRLIGQTARNTALDRGFVLCEKVQAMSFHFFDGSGKEYTTWDSTGNTEPQKQKAPTMIAVELLLVNPLTPERPYRFYTRFYLPFNRIETNG